MTNVEIVKKTNNGKNIENVEIEKMDVLQTMQVAKGVSELVKLVNSNEKLQNVFKTFNTVRQEVAKEAEEYYAEQKKKGVKVADIAEYDVGAESLARTGSLVWSDLVDVVGDLLYEAPETLVSLIANASDIKYDVLKKQDPEILLDVFDAVVEINDIEKLVGRIKKSKNPFNKVTTMFKAQGNKTEQVQQ